MPFKIGFLAGLDFVNWEPRRVLESLSKLGYKGIEWTLAHFNPRTKSQKELNALVKLTKDYGMEISEIVVQQDIVCLDEKVREDRIKLVAECIQTASRTGVSVLNLFTGPAPWDPLAPKVGKDISEGVAWEMVMDAYKLFVELAEEYKIHLAIEGVWGMLCHDYYTTKLLIDKFNSPYIGVNFDPSHDILSENFDIGWIIRQWDDKIKHIHLKDAVGIPENGKFICPLLGEGNVNWQEFFKALDKVDYQGYMSVEFESFTYYRQILHNNPEAAAKISIEQVKRLLRIN